MLVGKHQHTFACQSYFPYRAVRQLLDYQVAE
jgi:hypothetical protein